MQEWGETRLLDLSANWLTFGIIVFLVMLILVVMADDDHDSHHSS